MWCKASKKKHKRWEGDAVLVARGRTVLLKDMEGKDIGRGEGDSRPLLPVMTTYETHAQLSPPNRIWLQVL